MCTDRCIQLILKSHELANFTQMSVQSTYVLQHTG